VQDGSATPKRKRNSIRNRGGDQKLRKEMGGNGGAVHSRGKIKGKKDTAVRREKKWKDQLRGPAGFNFENFQIR